MKIEAADKIITTQEVADQVGLTEGNIRRNYVKKIGKKKMTKAISLGAYCLQEDISGEELELMIRQYKEKLELMMKKIK